MKEDNAAFCFFAEVGCSNICRLREEVSGSPEPVACRVCRDGRACDNGRSNTSRSVCLQDICVQVADSAVYDDCATVGGLHEVEDGIGGVANRDEKNLEASIRYLITGIGRLPET